MKYWYWFLIFSFSLLISNCSEFNDETNLYGAKASLDRTSDEEIDFTKDSEEVLDIVKEVDNMSNKEVLAYAVASDKPVKICMSYVYSESAASHQCDNALFDVFINGVQSDNKLNLNNAVKREVRGLKSKRTIIIPEPSTQTDINAQIRKRAYPNDMYAVLDVPGIEYEGQWDSEGNIVINTTCDKDLQSCHKGVASFHMIGTVDIIYKGYVITKTMRSKVGKIATDKEVSFNFKTIDLEKFDDSIYEFDDWCQPLFVEKSKSRVKKSGQ